MREFLLKTKKTSNEILSHMGQAGILAGISYDQNTLLVAVTEKRTKKEIDNFVQLIKEYDNV